MLLHALWASFKNEIIGQVLVAHACNTTYSGGKYQKDCSSKPALGKLFERPYLEKTITKRD
jgi:hypothetical protein